MSFLHYPRSENARSHIHRISRRQRDERGATCQQLGSRLSVNAPALRVCRPFNSMEIEQLPVGPLDCDPSLPHDASETVSLEPRTGTDATEPEGGGHEDVC